MPSSKSPGFIIQVSVNTSCMLQFHDILSFVRILQSLFFPRRCSSLSLSCPWPRTRASSSSPHSTRLARAVGRAVVWLAGCGWPSPLSPRDCCDRRRAGGRAASQPASLQGGGGRNAGGGASKEGAANALPLFLSVFFVFAFLFWLAFVLAWPPRLPDLRRPLRGQVVHRGHAPRGPPSGDRLERPCPRPGQPRVVGRLHDRLAGALPPARPPASIGPLARRRLHEGTAPDQLTTITRPASDGGAGSGYGGGPRRRCTSCPRGIFCWPFLCRSRPRPPTSSTAKRGFLADSSRGTCGRRRAQAIRRPRRPSASAFVRIPTANPRLSSSSSCALLSPASAWSPPPSALVAVVVRLPRGFSAGAAVLGARAEATARRA